MKCKDAGARDRIEQAAVGSPAVSSSISVLMVMVSEAVNVPSDLNALGSSTAAWLGRAHKQNATVQARIIHLIDTILSATVHY